MFYVYVLKSEEQFYIGYSADLRTRFAQHNEGKNVSTKGRTWTLFYYEAYQTEAAARKRESVLKGHGRTKQSLLKRLLDDAD
jgi:putative endonuclease